MNRIFDTKPDKCPNCGSENIAEIIYGKVGNIETDPATGKSVLKYSPRVEEKLNSGKYILGGCIYSRLSPFWFCKDCKMEMYKRITPDEKENYARMLELRKRYGYH